MNKTATVNISMPVGLYAGVKTAIKERGYTSVSEVIRDAVRRLLYPQLTTNGFTREFEESVLEAAGEPIENDIMLKTEEDIDNYFLKLKSPRQSK